jgi:hypothetical protein
LQRGFNPVHMGTRSAYHGLLVEHQPPFLSVESLRRHSPRWTSSSANMQRIHDSQ